MEGGKNLKNKLICTPEFVLIIVMLVVLAFLVFVVLWVPVTGEDSSVTASDLLDFRQSVLATIITAFGAWVGAGAAYYFGRENLREATQKMLEMREQSPIERLRQTLLREIQPRQVDWWVKIDEEVKEVMKKLKKEPERWFIPIINDDETLRNVLKDEAVFRYVIEKDNKMEGTMKDVLEFLEGQTELQRRTKDNYIEMKLNKNAGFANDLMQDKDVKLGIITNEKGKPTHYITTDDLRKTLMREST